MTRLVQQILEAAGAMPDATAHARYLETLITRELQERLEALRMDRPRRESPQVEFWGQRAVKTLESTL